MTTEEIRTALEAGRAATADAIRRLADTVDALPVEDAATTLEWLLAQIDRLQREATRLAGGG